MRTFLFSFLPALKSFVRRHEVFVNMTATSHDILEPATVTAKILGIYPYNNHRLVYTKMRLIQICLCLATSILSTIFYFRNHQAGRASMLKIVTFLMTRVASYHVAGSGSFQILQTH
jgi:hypothetical protein